MKYWLKKFFVYPTIKWIASRKEYWIFRLLQLAIITVSGSVLAIILLIIFNIAWKSLWQMIMIPFLLFHFLLVFYTIIIIIWVSVRRLHDTDKSAWWLLLWPIALINIMFIKGWSYKENRYLSINKTIKPINNKVKNRWLIAISAIGIHISIWSIYAYSVMKKPLEDLLWWESTDISFWFSIAILCLWLSAAFLGKFVEKYWPRASWIFCSVFYGIGVAGIWLAVTMQSLVLFYLTFGVLWGIGLWVWYITPVSTLVKWFPDRRGLATGMAIMWFWFSAMIFWPLMAKLFISVGISNTFYILWFVYFTLIFLSSLYIAPPKKWWLPENMKNAESKKNHVKDLAQCTAPEAAKTLRFYLMWAMFFINITCWIAIISVASPMAQDVAGLTAMQAATMVGFLGIFNWGGRLIWSTLSDYLGRANTYALFFVIQIIAFFTLPLIVNAILFQTILFLILTCYGWGFAICPAFLWDLFGTKQLGAIHGYTLTAWAAAGVVGPTLVSYIRVTTGSYNQTLYIFATGFVVAFILSIFMKLNIKKIRNS